MNIDQLNKICIDYQEILENLVGNFPSGSCYMSAFCLSEFLNSKGFSSRNVAGNLALIDKNGKYIIYGNLKLKGKKVGDYHAWCETTIDNKTYIIDPSLKYNIVFLKKTVGIKLSPKIPSSLITTEKDTYNWKYVEDEKLMPMAQYFLNLMTDNAQQILTLLTVND